MRKLVTVLCVVAACQSATAPAAGSYRVLIGGGAGNYLTTTTLSGQVAGRISPVPAAKLSMAVDTARDRLFVVGQDATGPLELVEVSLQTGHVTRTTRMRNVADTVRFPRLEVIGAYAIAPTSDGKSLLVDGDVDSTRALVLVDLASLKPTKVFDSLALAPGGIAAGTRLFVLGHRTTDAAVPDQVFILNAQGDSLLDSLAVSASFAGRSPDARQVLPSPDGESAFVVTPTQVARYDLSTHLPTATRLIDAPSGSISMSANGDRIFLMGDYTFDSPGTGRITEFDAALDSIGTIDLTGWSVGANPPVLVQSATGPEGQTLYVSSGTSSLAGFPEQRARLFVIGLSDHPAVAVDSLEDWGPTNVYLFPSAALLP